jgi:hypothetical protein
VKEKNINWVKFTVAEELEKIKNLYAEKVKQKWQEKMTPIKEAVVVLDIENFRGEDGNLSQNVLIQKLGILGKQFKDEFGIQCFQIHVHLDEGKKIEGKITPLEQRNLHAHMLFNWQDPKTGKMRRLSPFDMKKVQTITAEVLGLPRGQENSKAERLEHREYRQEMERMNETKENLLREIEEKKKRIYNLTEKYNNLKKISI